MKNVFFERALFLSWYCSKADCKFCYMSTQKDRIKNPRLARRRFESIFAEAIISRLCNWKIEFLSGGYDSFSADELACITKTVCKITKQKQWLNIGALTKDELKRFKPYIQGVCGTVECINQRLRAELCPSKPLKPILDMFKACDELGLKKTITIIIGLGETEKDIPLLIEFIRTHTVDKLTFYALNPHDKTQFKSGPKTEYYANWVSAVRQAFPKLEIVAGSWVDRLSEISALLKAGANNITKFPSIKLFSSKYAEQIEEEVKKAGKTFASNMIRLPDFRKAKAIIKKLNFDSDMERRVMKKLGQYRKQMEKNV